MQASQPWSFSNSSGDRGRRRAWLSAALFGLVLIGGGLVYSAGVIFYLWERIPYHKAIWHGLVLVAAVLQFSAVAAEFAR